MAAPHYRLLCLSLASTLVLSGLSIAQAAQAPSPAATSVQRQAQFTPPDDSNLDEDTVLTSTGTYFRPPDAKPLSGPTTPTGTRRGGCLGITETAFTVFGPSSAEGILGHTTSEYPSFVWHLPETDRTFPIIFRLLAPAADNIPDVIYETELDYTPGFMTHQLPTTEPALSPDVEYRWQVIIECNPAYPSRAIRQELFFEVVPTSSELSQALAIATTDAERAIAYGQAGVWYDAIAQVTQSTTPTDHQTRNGLLVDLAASLPATEEQLSQDILEIVEATP
ncbi:DUF928 domain-containing protein [Leptolyngbya cf. ectocarpi LEGE 11479]|uniref:DUF928 domain-containing protein n=1 Tax=Leptolyngbya cf. ectocarpi LEGE 11479 TaxID=1828722 RepID=A0A928ZV05_LEPEC|nr:DUF928 domain-containing protein [Leptolyngbya ectocarpi]MBE9067982.1 DUF928 domain-containing protein [Leptolyngbya cf. ectocarpi LEGE 11479]